MEIYFVERKKGGLVLEQDISQWGKNEGQIMATEICRRFAEEEHCTEETILYVVRIF